MLFVIWMQSYDVFSIELQAQTKQKPTKTEQIQKLFVSLRQNMCDYVQFEGILATEKPTFSRR